ncbi:hypothetical protein [Burkholderia ubonensis]|uniref:hypothetical protein n=1 Tax=Burkholderia ubonensis TaxID=101571 RepID=UPI000A78C835|nr:hypothetical protein [Burkholderia ubonensis]
MNRRSFVAGLLSLPALPALAKRPAPVQPPSTSSNHALLLEPMVSTDPGTTHAALVLTSQAWTGRYELAADLTLAAQLRTGSAPNPWETGWLLWNYQDDQHFYAFALQTNGWVLSKEDPAYPGAQRFLSSGSTPFAQPGVKHRIDIWTDGGSTQIYIDNSLVCSYTDAIAPYSSGRAGFYCEDSRVLVDNAIAGSISDTFDQYPLVTFSDGQIFGPWIDVFGGYGSVGIVSV